MSLINSDSKVVKGRFHLLKKLGAGSFGEIFEAIDLKSQKCYACKAENIRTKHPQLRLEWSIYRALQGSKNFVRVYGYFQHGSYNLMMMDKLGESMENLFNMCGRRFSIKTVCLVAIQILDRIRELHDKEYLHRDIKPDNFLVGPGDLTSKSAARIYMIDLGLGKKWVEHGRHIPEKHGKRLIGTPRYASINTHFGFEQSRRDDLESLGYMLMYFVRGHLPWQGLRGNTKEEKYHKIGQKKKDIPLAELCRGYPEEFRIYLKKCRQLTFHAVPPYSEFKSLFESVLASMNGGQTDPKMTISSHLYDWQDPTKNSSIKKGSKCVVNTPVHEQQQQQQQPPPPPILPPINEFKERPRFVSALPLPTGMNYMNSQPNTPFFFTNVNGKMPGMNMLETRMIPENMAYKTHCQLHIKLVNEHKKCQQEVQALETQLTNAKLRERAAQNKIKECENQIDLFRKNFIQRPNEITALNLKLVCRPQNQEDEDNRPYKRRKLDNR